MSNTITEAITYSVKRIAQDPAVYWHFLGTESWSRLLDAYAEITGQPREELEHFACPDEAKYRKQCETEERRADLDSGETPRCAVCDAFDEDVPEITEPRFLEVCVRFPQLLDAYNLIPDFDKPAVRAELARAVY